MILKITHDAAVELALCRRNQPVICYWWSPYYHTRRADDGGTLAMAISEISGRRRGWWLALVFLLLAVPTPAPAQDNPLFGLWRIAAGPMRANDFCAVERTSWYAQIAAYQTDSWLWVWNFYPNFSRQGDAIAAATFAQYPAADKWPEGNRPSQAVVDKINALNLELRFSGSLSADRRQLVGNETFYCFTYDGDNLTGQQALQVPIRASKIDVYFIPITPQGKVISSIKQGETFHIDFETGEPIDWSEAWAQLVDSDPTVWVRLNVDEVNHRFVSPALTIAEPPSLHLDMPAEALDGRLYAKPGTKLIFLLYRSLAAFELTVEAPGAPAQ